MPTSDERPDPASSPLAPSPGRATRATTHPDATADADTAAPDPPLKQHGDALLDGTGSRQGSPPDPTLDAAPHE